MKPPYLIALLLLLFLAATFNHPDNVSVAEARLLWIVRDEVRDYPSGIRDFARTALNNLQAMLGRTRGTFPLYPAILDLWTWVAGDSAEMARLFSAWCVLMGIVAILGLHQRFTLVMILLVPVLILAARQVNSTAFVFMLIALGVRLYWRLMSRQPQLQRIGAAFLTIGIVGYLLLNVPGLLAPKLDLKAINQVLAGRDPLHPMITAFPAESPAGYYEYRYGLREGIAPDLSWREFSVEEIDALVDGLTRGSYPIWVAMPKDDTKTEMVIAALEEQGYMQQAASEIDGLVFYRYELSSSSGASG